MIEEASLQLLPNDMEHQENQHGESKTEHEQKETPADKEKGNHRGCIKRTKGPWIARRTSRNGTVKYHYRYPSDKERQKNQERERKRREVARKIFKGLREHGNYSLPVNSSQNDLLRALCTEAGWHVEEDGTVCRKVRVKRFFHLS
ncbi:hypothetical protein Tsubulata_046384 [Turnera subulata]|uniref:Protein BZR1 homolog n=1 Tax=Turnera subulata TaxID=218843 RepID=A0A9Q0F046_9ROSI|nr:hypothetical protein Tsubulata_046384 [Turnera subulata]